MNEQTTAATKSDAAAIAPLRAFHGDPAIKEKYIARVRRHREAEQLVRGLGWNPDTQKGCAIGCTLEAYEHERYPIELGLPVWLARLEDAIFEGLPRAEAQAWPEAFLSAITPGADVEIVRHQLAIRRIDRLIGLQRGNVGKHGEAIDTVIEGTIAALNVVRRCHEAEQQGISCSWSAARSAARSAAESARSAAESAESAWSAAESAAESAWSAAWSCEASDLIELLRAVTPR